LHLHRFILSSPFAIHVFLTAPPADPAQWATCPQHVGSGTIFTTANTTVQPSVIVSGQVPLTHALAQAVDDGILASLEANHVVPLLNNSLEWRIQKVDGNPVDAEDLVDGKGKGRLKIGVISREVTPRVRDDAFPVYASWNTWPSITAGKVGGTKAAKPA
jgi:tyrosinase